KEYEVIIGKGILDTAGERIKALCPKAEKAAIISDDNVAPLYLERLEKSLEEQGLELCSFVFPHGEASKNGATYMEILSFMAQNHISRSDIAIALGGGVVGDITGFAAATYLRGISYVQIPTSLLAMVDSSVGGKTAIDLPEGKNLAGAFYQPELVLCDLDSLNTLSGEFFTDGCAEVLKYGVLADKELFSHLTEKGQDFDREYVVSRCVELKRDFVCEDEFDRGLRQKLNLGHTIGHAIENCSGYKIPHGSAVAMGMAIIAKISAGHGLCSKGCSDEICSALKALKLPVETEFSMDTLMQPMLSDKKRSGSKVSFIVPREIGDCSIYPVAVDKLEEFIKAEK
ncbi:MAG: 3-dehydroquinate synthase, partial [Oscillospiraceae bacterium]|nr:3-dehydroquinate synthase [Oscillospiraceae bacterium]